MLVSGLVVIVVSVGMAQCLQADNNGRCKLWEYNFVEEGIDENVWNYEVTAGGGGNEEFQMYVKNPDVAYVDDESFVIRPRLWPELVDYQTGTNFPDDFFKTGVVDINGGAASNDYSSMFGKCTDSYNYGCMRNNKKIPPVLSSRLNTQDRFQFLYGRIDVVAKIPGGDWMWPAIWLLPAMPHKYRYPFCGELDLIEARGNAHLDSTSGDDFGNHRVTAAMHYCGYEYYDGDKIGSTPFTEEYHTYSVDWHEDRIEYLVDGEVILDFSAEDGNGLFSSHINVPWDTTDGKLHPFDEEFYIVLNVAVGGRSQFFHNTFMPQKPWDSDTSCPFKTMTSDFMDAKDDWFPNWESRGCFRVKSITYTVEDGQSYSMNGQEGTCSAN